MGRWIIFAVVVVVALTIYALVDCAMSETNRTRVLSKPVWIVVVLLLPVLGALLWLLLGKGTSRAVQGAPDNNTAFLHDITTDTEHDARIADLEAQLRELDEEIERARHTESSGSPAGQKDAPPPASEQTPDEPGTEPDGHRQ